MFLQHCKRNAKTVDGQKRIKKGWLPLYWQIHHNRTCTWYETI